MPLVARRPPSRGLAPCQESSLGEKLPSLLLLRISFDIGDISYIHSNVRASRRGPG